MNQKNINDFINREVKKKQNLKLIGKDEVEFYINGTDIKEDIKKQKQGVKDGK